MAKTGIYTQLLDTTLGIPSVNDSIAMLVAPATAVSPSFFIDTTYQVSSMDGVKALGITEENNPQIFFNATEFFEKAGSGMILWIVGYNGTSADTAKAFIYNTFEQCVKNTTKALFNNRPRLIGWVGDKSLITDTETTDPLLPELVKEVVGALSTAQQNLDGESIRTCMVVDAIMLNCKNADGFGSEQIATTLDSLVALNAPFVGVHITTSTPGHTASVGQVLGIQASVSLATSIGNMQLGPVNDIQYFIDANAGNYVNTNVAEMSCVKYEDMGQKQYIFTRTRPQKAGVYYNDGGTCNDATKALSSLEFCRVGNAVCDSVEGFFVDLLNTNIPTDTSGKIDNAYKAATLDDLDQRFLRPRINRGEAASIVVDFKAKENNFIMSRAIEVTVQILPLASLREVYIYTFFVSSLS